MITYREYYNRMAAIEKFLNEASDHTQINVSGMTDREAVLYQAGKYFQALASATMPSFIIEKCSFPIGVLVHLVRKAGSSFNFGLMPCEEVDSDRDLAEMWKEDYICYTRMSATSMLGAATTVIGCCDISMTGSIELGNWSSCQAEHLAKYCIAHDFDLTRAVSII